MAERGSSSEEEQVPGGPALLPPWRCSAQCTGICQVHAIQQPSSPSPRVVFLMIMWYLDTFRPGLPAHSYCLHGHVPKKRCKRPIVVSDRPGLDNWDPPLSLKIFWSSAQIQHISLLKINGKKIQQPKNNQTTQNPNQTQHFQSWIFLLLKSLRNLFGLRAVSEFRSCSHIYMNVQMDCWMHYLVSSLIAT